MQNDPFDFSVLEKRGIALLDFAPGEKVFLQGETGDSMYIVKSGRVDIITFGTVLENVAANGHFGEMALIDDAPRSAAAIAQEATQVAPINKETFLFLVGRDPRFALRVMHTLADRIRRMNESL